VLTGMPWLTPGRIRSEPLVPDRTTAAGRGVATVAQAATQWGGRRWDRCETRSRGPMHGLRHELASDGADDVANLSMALTMTEKRRRDRKAWSGG
jgi:hypothetical protein